MAAALESNGDFRSASRLFIDIDISLNRTFAWRTARHRAWLHKWAVFGPFSL